MKKILLSGISLIMTVSFLVSAPVTEKETDTHSLQKEKSARKNKDHSLVKSEAEILVEIEAKILEVNKDTFLDAFKDREGSPNVISDSQANILLNALTREEATDLLCAPRITVKNGEKAEIKVVQEFVIPTGKPSEQTTGGGVGRQAQEIGFELAVTPTVQKNNQIHLQLNPKVTQFDGFVESGGPSDPTGGIGFSKRLPPGILMPTFSARKIATQVTLPDGATAIIDALTRVEIKKVNEKIPVLGNLPLVCGLFSTESNQTRSLIMFVSAKIASAESSPDRENIQNNTSQSTSKDPGKLLAELNLEKLRTEQKLNEQLDKANKKLGEILAIYNQQIIAINNQLNGESPKLSKVEMIKTEQRLNKELNKANKRLAKIIALMNQLNGESPKSSKVDIIKTNQKLNEQLNKRIFKLQHAETKDIQAILDEVIKNQQLIKQQVQGRKTGARPTAGTTAGKPAPATAAATAAQNTATGSDQAGEGSHEFSDFITISSNETSNVILVYGTKEDIVEIGRMIDSLDQPLPQETIETIYVMVDLTEQNQRGIDALLGNLEWSKFSKVEIIGIGAKLIDVNGSCTIAELIPGGPAEKSQQLEPKDVILKVSKSDGTLADISDMKLYEIVELIKGPKNSKVKLLIQPFKNPSTPKEVSIKRKPFHIYHQTHENKVSEKASPIPTETQSGKKLIIHIVQIHIVQKGDTVKSIAKKYGSKVKWILDANQMTDPEKIKVGEEIKVPQKKPVSK